jgi:hypothetical protein
VLPNFLPPSSPELSALLSTFNSKVLLPSHLTAEQQKLVYSQESRAKLEAEPVEITLGDVTLPLEHIDRNRLPNRFKHLKQIISKSETKEDWENVVRCLEGFEEAGIEVRAQWQEMVVRQLNLAGMQHLVLKALQRPKASSIRLSNLGVLRQVLRTVHDKAALADWAQEDTHKSFKLAKQVVELMEDEEHCGSQKRRVKKGESSEGDWRGRPSVVALPTEMAAVLAEKYGGDKEEVKKLCNRLINALKQSEYLTALDATSQRSTTTAADFPNITTHLIFLSEYSIDLLEVVIVWNALKTCRKVLGAELPMREEAQQFEARSEEVLKQAIASLDSISKDKAGKPLKSAFVTYIKDALERCR